MEKTSTDSPDAVQRKDYVVKTEELDPTNFPISPFYRKYIKSVLISEADIEKRAAELAAQIADTYKERPYYVIITLKGAVETGNIICKYLKKIYESGKYNNCVRQEYIRAKSYENTETTGVVALTGGESFSAKDKEILIIEDIVDTGTTIKKMIAKYKNEGAKSVKIAALTIKEDPEDLRLDFIGFKVPKVFIVGFGLDYNEYLRDLSFIGVLNGDGIEAFKA